MSCNGSFRYSAKHNGRASLAHVMRDFKEGILNAFEQFIPLFQYYFHFLGYIAFRPAVSVRKVVRGVLYCRSAYKGRRPVR